MWNGNWSAATRASQPLTDSLMQRPGRKCLGGFLAIALGYIALTGIAEHLTKHSNLGEKEENAKWIGSSRNWLDKQLCRWVGMCGTFHLNSNGWTWEGGDDDIPPIVPDWSHFWHSDEEDPDSWSREEKELREIPQYVIDHAPYVHLFSDEHFWPGDIAEHLAHLSPRKNYTKIDDWNHGHGLNLTNLNELNDYEGGIHGRFVYLQSNENVEEQPEWLGGAGHIPQLPDLLGMENDDADAVWPSSDDVVDQVSGLSMQEATNHPTDPEGEADTAEFQFWPTEPTPSKNGRCSGNSGFTCKGSGFGPCCSIYGWCGRGEEFCGQACDILGGRCSDPFEPFPRPRSDLKRRQLSEASQPVKKYQSRPNQAGRSSAPAHLIVVQKEDGIVDAFWFFFYSFNLGQKVFNIRFGNHVGDWEHTMIRFKDGVPTAVFVSEHNFGSAYKFHALEKYTVNPDGSGTMIGTWSNHTAAKIAKRPVVYAAVGTHAMYPTPGLHPYILPYGILHDQTDRGPLWDPTLNLHSYTWNMEDKKVRASTRNPKLATNWFDFAGHWGDKYYPLSDPRQYRFAGQYHYVNGPTGPRWKNLARSGVCLNQKCRVRDWVGDSRIKRLPIEEDEEEGGLPGGNFTNDT